MGKLKIAPSSNLKVHHSVYTTTTQHINPFPVVHNYRPIHHYLTLVNSVQL